MRSRLLAAALALASPAAALEIPFLEQAPMIDGSLDDAAWQKAAQITDFMQYEPKEGLPMTEPTTAYVGYDKDNLYFAFYAADSTPSKIRAHLTPRDGAFEDDFVGITADTFGDQRRAYEFFCNPLGVQMDMFSVSGTEDISPDFVWYSAGKIQKDGYVVEMRIPFKSMRFSKQEDQHWRLFLMRNIQRKNEKSLWPTFLANRGSMFSQMADVTGIKNVNPGKRLEIVPEFTGSKATPSQSQKDSFHLGASNVRAGANVRYGITPNWTWDSTYNPDFSQVETDPAQIQVNQRFPIFFAEKRPFFMEGADLFETPMTVVHTRTIVDPAYGIKLTGKEGPYSTAVLTSRDRSRGGSLFDIVRIKRDVGQESSLGAIYSDRSLAGGRYNRVGGIDGNFHFGNHYTLEFQGAESATDKSSVGSIDGPAYHFIFSRRAREFQFDLTYDDISPRWQADSGFTSRVDYRESTVDLWYDVWRSGGVVQKWTPGAGYTRTYDHEGHLTDEQTYWQLKSTLPLQTHTRITYFPSILERFGGIDFIRRKLSLTLDSQPTSFLSMSFVLSGGDQIAYIASPPFLGNGLNSTVSVTLKPVSRLSLEQTYLRSRLDSKAGGRVFDENVYRSKVSFRWSREISSRLIYQYATLGGRGFADALVSYLLVPGTAVHVGYDLSFARSSPSFRRSSETFFTKLSYLFRI